MKKLIFLLLLFPLSIFPQQNIILHTENEPPFSMRKNEMSVGRPDDPLKGIAVEILNILFSRLKIPQIMRIDSWEKSYQKGLLNANQGVFSTTRTPERERFFKWVGPLVANDWYFLGNKDFEENFGELRDPKFKRFKIGTLKDGAIATLLKSNGIQFIELDSNLSSALALKERKIDLWAVGGQPGYYYARKGGVENLKKVFLIKRHQFLYLALNINTPDSLVHSLNKELGIMRRDGTIANIYKRYR